MNYKIESENVVMPKFGIHPPQEWVGTWTLPAHYLYLVVAPGIPVFCPPSEECDSVKLGESHDSY